MPASVRSSVSTDNPIGAAPSEAKVTDPNSWGIPNISLAQNLTSFGNPTSSPFQINDKYYQFIDNFSWVIGKHALRMGGEFRINQFPQLGNEFPRGQFFFSGQFTNTITPTCTAAMPTGTMPAPTMYTIYTVTLDIGQTPQVVAAPAIITNALSAPEDLEAMLAGMRLAREFAAQAPLQEIVLEELKPGAAYSEREELEADLRRRLMLIYHPVGTARMSDTEPDAVVDSQLRVHGLQGLRVIDASIMPVIPRGNTNAPTIMIAERGADLVRGRAPLPEAQLARA